MAFDYDGARAEAFALISEYGEAGQVVLKGTKGGFDSEGNATPDVPDVVIDGTITPLLQYRTREIDGTNILSGDTFVFFHSETAPEINMQVTINSKTLRIINIYKLDSVGGVNVFRKLQLRA